MNILSKKTTKGIAFSLNNKSYHLEYPENIWASYPKNMKDVFLDNFSFLKVLPTALLFQKREVNLNTSYPLFHATFYRMMMGHLPFSADTDKTDTIQLIKDFMNINFKFKDYKTKYPSYNEYLEEKGIINFTFGKDSLLTFALSKEIDIPTTLVYVEEPDVPLEVKYRYEAIKKFNKEFQIEVKKLYNETALMRCSKYLNLKESSIGDGQIITEYCLAMLPFSHYYKAKYIIFGNEQSCNKSYINKDGFLTYPVFDQSPNWMIEMSNIAKQLTNNQVEVISLVESLNDLAIIKILHNRYKEIGKYQMSCFPDDNPYGKSHYWCHHCSKCARIFIMLLANNVEPRKVGFTETMLGKEYKNYYSLFGRKENMVGWDKSNCGRDEQLLAFYLAYKNGAKGYLIDGFKKQFLNEAKTREDELINQYFKIYDSTTIPKKLKSRILSIYKEELN